MKKILLILIFSLLPSLVFADIAWPVLTKIQACQEQDGESRNRLQIFLNGKKSDTLYFYKKENSLFYIVPMFPYSQKEYAPEYGNYQGTYTYYAGLFLYHYDCSSKVARLLSAQNLKKLIDPKKVFSPAIGIWAWDIKEFSYWRVYRQEWGFDLYFDLWIPQTWTYQTIIFNRKTKKFNSSFTLSLNES